MKAIILSAGQGSRLGHLVDDRPKCLIDFSGRTLLDRQLDTLAANGVDEAVVVTGFHDELVEQAIAERSGGPKGADGVQPLLQGRRQHRVAVHGPRGAGRRLPGVERRHAGFALADGDGWSATTGRAFASPSIARTSYDDDDMKVVEEGGRLKAIGKRLEGGVNAESIGLLAFRDGGAERFRRAIEQAMRTPEGTTIWYLRVINHLAQSSDVWTLDISGEEWGEVDFPPDVERARELTARWDAAGKAAAA